MDDVTEILLPWPHYANMFGHVVRKLTGHQLDREVPERKAFGILAGLRRGGTLTVTAVFPLLANLRRGSRYAAATDEIVHAHAVPFQNPNEQRGWTAHSRELLQSKISVTITDV